jgi:prophage regulatory protein
MMHLKNSHSSLTPPLETILRKSTVLNSVGISGPTLWRWIKNNNFPQPVSLGGRSVGWLQSEVADWIEARAAKRHIAQPRREMRAL